MEISTTNLIKEAALSYVKKGLAVIPLKGRYGADYNDAKLPKIKVWQKVVANEDLIHAWFGQKSEIDIGLLCGKSNNIFCLDADKAVGMATAAALKLPDTVINVTPNGKQYLFEWDIRLDGIPTNLVKPFESLPGLDFRGEGGFIVAPPSKNLGDKLYQWNNDEGILAKPLAKIPEWLVQMFLERTNVGEDIANAPQVAGGWFEEIYNGMAEGENRHKGMCKLASFYMSRGLPEDDVVTLMKLWNQKCTPPKEEALFVKKLDQFLANWRPGGKYKSNFKQAVTNFQVQNGADFLKGDDVEIEWLAEGVIPAETISFLHAYGGIGKSFFALDLGIEIGRGGGKWLGHFPTKAGRVLYIDEELNPKLIKQRYRKMLKAKDLNAEEVDLSFLSLQQFRLDIPESVQAMKGIFLEYKPDLVILDPFVALHQLNENSTIDMAGLRHVLKDLVKTCNCSFIIVDHESKPSMVLTSSAQRQRGSSEKDALADLKIALSKDSNGQILVEHSKARWTAPFPSFKAEIIDTTPGEAIAVQYLGLA